jgi:hypothetical protein
MPYTTSRPNPETALPGAKVSRRSLLSGMVAAPVLYQLGPLSAEAAVNSSDPASALFFRRSGAASAKKVFPHYFGQLPRSLDNGGSPDYYDRSLLRVAGEGGKHASYGGYLRDRPLPRPSISGDYLLEDAKWEIRTAQAMGADGFFVNITSIAGTTWNRYLKLVDAAVQLGTGFVIIPMIDTNGSVRNATPVEIATALSYFAGKPSTYLEDGRMLISCFKCEGFSVDRWQAIFAAVTALTNVPVSFAGILLGPGQTAIAKYAPIADYLGNWSIGADPAMLRCSTNTAGRAAEWARAAGCGWIGTSHTQINVPYTSHYFDEAANSEALRESWRKIFRQQADHVQCVTWCDFSEGGQLTPSVAKGWSQYAITAYYIERYKTGTFPAITKDVLFLSHRNQPLTGATYQSGQTELMTQAQRSAMTPLRDRVEALTYLTAPATVRVRIGSSSYTYDAPAGEYAKTFPNALGTVSGSFSRNGIVKGSVTSPFRVTANPVSQDRQYFFVSSLHGTTMQQNQLVHL